MQIEPKRITPLSESAVVVEFGNEISVELNLFAIALSDYLSSNPFPGFIEAVPAYASTAVYFDPFEVRNTHPEDLSAFESVYSLLKVASIDFAAQKKTEESVVEIPTNFASSVGLDLQFVAETNGLTTDEVISIFKFPTYRVYMIGFLPGFAYMGEVDPQIQTPRRSQPRSRVPKGSVGIAGAQTGIYPLESPGGWQIIGRTEVEMFLRNADPPALLKPGDRVRFVPA